MTAQSAPVVRDVRVGDGRRDVRGRVAGAVSQAARALHVRPAEAGPAGPPRQHVDLLPGALADVADVDVAAGAVDAEAPRIAQADGVDLRSPVGVAREAVVGRDDVGPAVVHVQAQQLAEQRPVVQAVAVRVVAGAAVAGADDEHAVRVEGQHAALVRRVDLRDDEQRPLGGLHGTRRLRVDAARPWAAPRARLQRPGHSWPPAARSRLLPVCSRPRDHPDRRLAGRGSVNSLMDVAPSSACE